MLKNENIICISSIDWDFIWQGHQEIMSTFAKNGNKVLFIENTGVRSPSISDIPRIKSRIKNWFKGVKGIRQEMENLYIFSPLVLPFPYSRLVRFINRHLLFPILERWIKEVNFSNPIVWTFLPTPLSLDIIDNFVKKAVIYYCIDNFSASSISAKKIRNSEISLFKKADLVFVTSRALYDYSYEYNKKVHIFPFAVNFNQFEKVRIASGAGNEELNGIRRPIVGYVGGVHKWIDQALIKEVAEKHPEYSFVFVGPIQTDISLLSRIKNIYFLGNKVHGKLPLFIKDFDICMIPYLITDYTRNVYPTKLNEYLAMGKAVISTPLPEVIEFNRKYKNIVYIATAKESFYNYIKKALSENGLSLIERRVEIAKENSWENRIEEMSSLINSEVERKKVDKNERWKENLLVFYRKARRKAIFFATACVILYSLVFKTPFIWFFAGPLKITEIPQKADAIVVFGGGVGETGSPGKSTIERARYAAQLYKENYASKIIFSSGYTYTYNDAENMRLIALSMGVPDKAIILEDKANSTYENVIFSKEILEKNKWRSILLVSSPYNMRRAAVVFNKWGHGIKVFYTPVQKCQFYDRSEGIQLDQIRAIIHEYLGIIYYWFKGYV